MLTNVQAERQREPATQSCPIRDETRRHRCYDRYDNQLEMVTTFTHKSSLARIDARNIAMLLKITFLFF